MPVTALPHASRRGRRAAAIALVAVVGAVVVPSLREAAHAEVHEPNVSSPLPFETEDYYAGFDQPEADGPHLHFLHPVSQDGDDWSNQSGQMRVEVAIADPDDGPADLAVTVRLDLSERVPLPYDLLTGTWHAEIDTTKMADGPHLLFVRAVDPDGNVTADGGQIDLRNVPTVAQQPPPVWDVPRGDYPVEVVASDGQTPTAQLRVRVGAGRIVDGQGAWEDPTSWTPLHYDAATGHFLGVWDSREVPDDQLYRLQFEVTDGDGVTGTTARLVAPHNMPQVRIAGGLTGTYGKVDAVDTVRIVTTNARFEDRGVSLRWRVDGGPWSTRSLPDGTSPWATPGAGETAVLVAVDTVPLANGTHTFTADAQDQETGVHKVISQTFVVQHGAGLHVAITSPPTGAAASGVLTLEALAWGGALAGNPLQPASIWWGIGSNDGNVASWHAMQRTSNPLEARFTAQVDLRTLPPGEHPIEIAGTDYAGHEAHWHVLLAVGGATPMHVTLNSPRSGDEVSGAVPITATVDGGTLTSSRPSPVIAWYNVDDGPYRVMTTSGPQVSATWDSAEAAPGLHTVHVVATDWSYSALAGNGIIVSPRGGLQLTVASPGPGSSGPRPVKVVARAVSGTKGLSGTSVFARVSGGTWTALHLDPDGWFRGTVDPGRASVGRRVTIEVAATDYTTGTTATTTYTPTS